jgi:dihydrofolate reductase
VSPLSIIVAIADDGGIGLSGRVPWDLPEDRAYFARVTRGHAVIMGRRTWDETGGPLADRDNIVVSTTLGAVSGARVVRSLDEALALVGGDPEPFVIGGTRLFEEALPRVTRAHVTRVPGTFPADTFYHFDATEFSLVSRRVGDGGVAFEVYERARASKAESKR